MNGKTKDFRTGSLKGLKSVVEESDYDRLFPKNRYIGGDWLQKEYELDYFDGLEDLRLHMEGPEFMVKLRHEACAAHGIDLSHLDNNQMFGFPCEHRIFPNMLGPVAGNSYGLFRARPNGDDPDSMIWDIYFMFRHGEGEEPPVHYEFIPDWRNYPRDRMPPSFMRDFKITPLFQQGMHSWGFTGHRYCSQEQNVIHTQKLLDQIIGTD